MDKFQSTLLPQSNKPEDMQKTALDLLDKINKTAVDGVPSGAIVMHASATIPDGWLLCDGSAVSRSQYSSLFKSLGTTWGAGDGRSTFNVPDMRGAAPSGVGTSTGYTQNETITLGTKYNDQGQGHKHGPPNLTQFITTTPSGGAYYFPAGVWQITGGPATTTPITDGTNGTPRTGNVTRGKRVGVNFIIKT
jgi:hypothetical protein